MGFRHEGNGHGKVRIHTTKVSHGYTIIHTDVKTIAEGTPVILSQSVEKFLKENPTFRVRATFPVVKDGQTVAVHLWYDE
jgi:hypothetical protein